MIEKIRINLIITTLEPSTLDSSLEIKILSLLENQLIFPNCLLTEENKDKTIKEIYYNVFSNHILEIDPKWIIIRLLDIEKSIETNELDVYYTGSIPIESRLKNAYFINNNETMLSSIVQKASKYY